MKNIFKFLNDKDFVIRCNNKTFHLRLGRFTQYFAVFVVFLFVVAFGVLSCFKFNYSKNIESLTEELNSSRTVLVKVLSDIEAYRTAVFEIKSDIDRNYSDILKDLSESEEGIEVSDNLTFSKEMKLFKARFDNLDQIMRDKLIDYSNGNFDKNMVETNLAVMGRSLVIAELKEVKERTNLLEDSLKDTQSLQIQVFEKISGMIDGEVEEIDKKLSRIKKSMENTGYNFDKLYSNIEKDRSDLEPSQGGPFIPVVTNAIKTMPELQSDKLDETLVSLYSKIDKWGIYKGIEDNLPLGNPIPSLRVSAAFGNRFDPFNGEISLHEGIDIAEKEGTPVVVVASGKVTYTGRAGLYGLMIEVNHGYGVKTRYAHLNKIYVKKGDTLKYGDEIGEVGNTGRSTGSHLHYEVRINGKPINPYHFIKAKKYVLKS